MERQTPLADSIDSTELASRYDYACKRLLSDRHILAWILKSTVREFADIPVRDIAEKYIEGTPSISQVPVNPGETNANITGMNNEDAVYGEGKITYDIRFYAVYPKSGKLIKIIVNIEAQNDFYPGYYILKRGLFYACRMVSAQYNTEFREPHYNDIKKVYSIWICINPSQKAENTITSCEIHKKDLVGHVEDLPESYDIINVTRICLGRKDAENHDGIIKLLSVLLSDTEDAGSKKQVLADEFDIPMDYELEKEMNHMCNLGKGVLERGLIQGLSEGRNEGQEQVNRLYQLLKQDGRMDDLLRAIDDNVYQKQLLEEYGLEYAPVS